MKLEKKLWMLENIELRPRWFKFGYRNKMGGGSFPPLKEASKEERIRFAPFAVHLLSRGSGGVSLILPSHFLVLARCPCHEPAKMLCQVIP